MLREFIHALFLVPLVGDILVYRAILASPVLEVCVLFLERGNAVLVRSSSEKTLLIDTGPDTNILRALGAAFPMWPEKHQLSYILTSESSVSMSSGHPSPLPQ